MSLPRLPLKTRQHSGQTQVWDPVRRLWVVLLPEEEVRQSLLAHLLALGCPPACMAVERELQHSRVRRRFDVVLFGPQGLPLLLAECKAPQVPLGPAALQQLEQYNLSLQAPWLVMTNGHHLGVWFGGQWYAELPSYAQLVAGLPPMLPPAESGPGF